MKEYWLMLYPETFLWEKGKEGLLYQAQTGDKIFFSTTGKIGTICMELSEPINLYSVKIGLPQDEETGAWVAQVCQKKMGKLIPVEACSYKPVSLPPIVKIEEEKEKLNYLHEVIFYTGGEEREYPDYYKQLPHPVYAEETLSVHKIKDFLKQTEGYNLQMVSFVGLEKLPATERQALMPLFSLYPFKKKLITGGKYLDFYKDIPLGKNISLSVICHSIEELEKAKNHLTLNGKNVKYIYTLTNEAEYLKLKEMDLSDPVSIIPVFTESNLAFFEDHIYLQAKDLHDTCLSKREIFMNQRVNSHFFGKLNIMPNGDVYGNINKPSIGHIGDSIHNLLKTEFDRKDSWFYTREQKPCTDCIYQWLCPSPSNYEDIIGKHNLCHIKSKQ